MRGFLIGLGVLLVLALGVGDGEDLDVVTQGESLVDLQSGGAVTAVDEYLVSHGRAPLQA